MAPSKLTNAIGAVKDKTSIGLAKVGSTASISDLEIAIVKATRHEEYPPEERHIREILSLTCYSRAFVHACVATISRRLSKTRNWVVALKSLMLIQRLLADGDVAYQQEIFFATRRGTRLLNMSDFRDRRSDFWDYSAFVRMYGLYLDELLEFRGQGKRGRRETFGEDEEEEVAATSPVRATPVREMSNRNVFSRVQSLLYVLERFLACSPRGSTKKNRVVLMALYPIMKESFQVYYDIAEILSILVDRFMGLEVADSVKVYEIFCRVSNQLDELDAFYSWCKHVGIARAAEYPEVEKVPRQQLDTMDDYIRGKSNKEKHRRDLQLEHKNHQAEKDEEEEKKSEVVEEEEVLDMNAIKALPPPEGFPKEEEKEEEEEVKKEKKERDHNDIQKEPDLLNLGEDAETCQEHGNKLALALFDGGPERNITPAWEAFEDGENWETQLVQAASHLSNQKASLGGGFDMMVLDGMYQRGAIAQAMSSSGCAATGSASSVALGSAGRPAMLALPAPPAGDGNAAAVAAASTRTDPFAASLAVPPPSYVQMSEMEKKQKLLVEEQVMWQQYARDGMQGQLGLPKMQPNRCSYNMGAAYKH